MLRIGTFFRNLVCLDRSDKRLWEAEVSEPGRQDVYYRVASRRPLVANSFSSFQFELDPETGAIVSKTFFE